MNSCGGKMRWLPECLKLFAFVVVVKITLYPDTLIYGTIALEHVDNFRDQQIHPSQNKK